MVFGSASANLSHTFEPYAEFKWYSPLLGNSQCFGLFQEFQNYILHCMRSLWKPHSAGHCQKNQQQFVLAWVPSDIVSVGGDLRMCLSARQRETGYCGTKSESRWNKELNNKRCDSGDGDMMLYHRHKSCMSRLLSFSLGWSVKISFMHLLWHMIS